MGFLDRRADADLGAALERIKAGTDFGEGDPRPEIDAQQRRELMDEQAGGRTDAAYHQALTYHGFVWWPLLKLREQLPGATLKQEGEWRHAKMKLAFTPSDMVSSFPGGPEAFDRYIRDQKLARAVTRGKVPKQVLTETRRRRA